MPGQDVGARWDVTRRLSRRTLVALGGALLTPAVRGNAQGSTPAAAGCRFVDDHGTAVTLDRRPERIVAYVGSAATLWEYSIRPVGVFGPLQREDGSANPLAGNIDPAVVTWLGPGWNELDLEALVASRPALNVSTTYSPEIPGDLWELEPDVAEQAAQIAPAVAISTFETPVPASLARFEELAAALGADLGTRGAGERDRRGEGAR